MVWPKQGGQLFARRDFASIDEAVNFYETVIANLGVSFALLDRKNSIICIAPEALPKGTSEEQAVGKNFFDIMPHLLEAKFPEMIDRVFESSQPIIDLYARHTTSAGLSGFFHRKFFPVVISGVCEAIVLIVEDVNEYRLAKLHAHESEFRYQRLIESMNLISFRLDAIGKFTYINKASLQVFEWSPAEMLGTAFVQYVHKDDVGKFWKVFWQVVNKDQDYGTVEERIVTRTGKVKHIRWNIHPLYDEEGKIVGSQGVGEDITQQQELFENLQTSYGKYRGFFNALPVPVCIVGKNDVVVGASRKMCKLLLFSQKEMREMTIFDILSLDELPRFSKMWIKLKNTGGIPQHETVLTRKDGSSVRVMVNGVRFGEYYMFIFKRELSSSS